MRIGSGTALLVVLCLVALNLPQASAGRRYKRVCDLLGCQRCYTPSRRCFGRLCQDLYACDADRCGEGFVYNPVSEMCDCEPNHGMILGRCTYKRFYRSTGFSYYYPGYNGYNKLTVRSYQARRRSYGPNSYAYRPYLYVAGPYCQQCPTGTTSEGGEPMHTFCLPVGITGSVVPPPGPIGPGVDFKVKVTFIVPGGCGPLKYLDVQTVSVPTGITCKPAKVDYDCQATTYCKASKDGNFMLSAKLKGVSGIVAGPANVGVGGAQPDAAATTEVTINVNFNDLTEQQKQKLTTAATGAATALTAELKTAKVTVQFSEIKAGELMVNAAKAAQVGVSAVPNSPALTVIIFTVRGTAPLPDETLNALQAAWPKFLTALVIELQKLDLQNMSEPPGLVGVGDVTAVILVKGEPFGESPIVPNELPNPDNKVGVTVNAVAGLGILPEYIPDAQNAILATARNLLNTNFGDLANAGTTIDSVTITTPSATSTPVVVKISCPEAIGDTVLAAVKSSGTKNIIIGAINTLAAQLQIPLGFSITIDATLEPITPRR